ncbi:hypothetical protein VST63_19695 [Mycolicibacterium sp. 050232]|uniref:hypothetical protein n=1 Tax=Mycolicibacterium sp. 050232 TaxID=3113982 RepID=UPI002E2C87B2|nr:hypothetical protein [Mycolicibacterium sp. 050232]MED5814587.1 hypothetical protein [Mycolicibacterium sp. 050232]
MIVLTDTVQTWGHTATVHYSHAPRAVVAQSSLALHSEFNVNLPPRPIFRSFGFFRTAVVDGTTVTVNGPSLVSAGVTELHFDLLTDNGASMAVINQFDTTGTFSGPPVPPVSVRRVSFHRPMNGTTAYAHTTKVYAGGRDISEHEAVETARATLISLGMDSANLIMKVTTDADLVSRLQRLDPSTNELVDQDTDLPIG